MKHCERCGECDNEGVDEFDYLRYCETLCESCVKEWYQSASLNSLMIKFHIEEDIYVLYRDRFVEDKVTEEAVREQYAKYNELRIRCIMAFRKFIKENDASSC